MTDAASLQVVYMEEDVVSVEPAAGNANGQDVLVRGSGFDPAKTYHCALFSVLPTGPSVWVASSGAAVPGVQDIIQAMTVINSTAGNCTVKAGFSSQPSGQLTLLRVSLAYNQLSGTTGVRQPIISYVSNNVMFFKSTNYVVQDSWTSLSSYSGQRGGGDTITVTGAGFDAAKAYTCEFSIASPAVAVGAPATVLSSTLMTCVSPGWTQADGNTVFRVRDSAGLVRSNQPNVVSFFFLKKPTWNEAASVAANEVVVEGVGCGRNTLRFRADAGGSELRMTVSYTPLRPTSRHAFVLKGDAAPTLADVLRTTERLTKRTFLQGAMVDVPLPDGRPSLTVVSHTLLLPTGPQPLKATKGGVAVNIPDNVAEPSGLNMTSVTRCGGVADSACGTMLWAVTRGWEGYAYEICVTARHAIVPATVVDSAAFNTRCVYFVVPKCRRCYTPTDSLHAISASYGTTWVDLWSVNPALSNTTRVSASDEVGFNTPGDMVYIRVEHGRTINTGILYSVGGKDSLTGIAKRFGMTLSSLLALNPDVVSSNQDADMTGKKMCILQQSKIYNRCAVPIETPNPVFWDKIEGYDETGVAIKQWNPRYPRQPIGGIPRHG